MPGRLPLIISPMLLLLIPAGCTGTGWMPALTLGLQAIHRDGSSQALEGETAPDFRVRAIARLGWCLDATPEKQNSAIDLTAARNRPPALQDDSTNRRCRSRALCAWEHRQRARALGAALED